MISKSWSANIKSLDAIQTFVEKSGFEYGFNSGRLIQINLAVEEVVVNIINHAFDNGNSKQSESCTNNICLKPDIKKEHEYCKNLNENLQEMITIEIENYADSMMIRIIDAGKSFDPLKTKDPDTTLSIKDRPIGGLGIFMVKKLVDKLYYIRKNNHNILTMVFLRQNR